MNEMSSLFNKDIYSENNLKKDCNNEDKNIVKKDPVKELPKEMLKEIFNYLNKKDVNKLFLLNKQYNEKATEYRINNYTSFISNLKESVGNNKNELNENFIDYLNKNLKELDKIKQEKPDKIQNNKLIKLINLSRIIAKNIFVFKLESNNENKRLNEIEKHSPSFHKLGIFSFMKEFISSLPTPHDRIQATKEGCKNLLMEQGWVPEAIDLANTIDEEIEKAKALEELADSFMEQFPPLLKVIELVHQLPNEEAKEVVLPRICHNLVKQNRMPEAIEIANMIPSQCHWAKLDAFDAIFGPLNQKNHLSEEALIELAQNISDEKIKNEILIKLKKQN